MPKLYGKIEVHRLSALVKIVPGGVATGGGNLQEKTVTPAVEAQVVTPDGGYSGMSRVNVAATPLQDKIVPPSTAGQNVQADEGYVGLGTVMVQGAALQEKTAELTDLPQTVEPDAGFYGLARVAVPGNPRAAAVSYVQDGDTITAAVTLKDGAAAKCVFTLDEACAPVSIAIGEKEMNIDYDEDGLATSVTIDGEDFPISWEGFDL